MSEVKAQKQGDSITLTIPNALEIEAGEEFYFVKKENGVIILIPKEENKL